MADLERPRLKVGFIPIIDCAPIVLAEELGAFERQEALVAQVGFEHA